MWPADLWPVEGLEVRQDRNRVRWGELGWGLGAVAHGMLLSRVGSEGMETEARLENPLSACDPDLASVAPARLLRRPPALIGSFLLDAGGWQHRGNRVSCTLCPAGSWESTSQSV